ncbi:DNA-3-methyladenine glycosylase 2 family protein [Patulibacter americanus]|uniref:DNA-3-methyladenine glycosylase 2 family protein n=1 Tax=Patulibacter americanus TaxID=588672 RepID=UPI0003B655BF|nr:AlkA N-terminal domain-containing protein [Patulibacter americanus]
MPAATTHDFAQRYAAVQSRDRRFDGRFYTAVTSTGIYCRPSCPARTPQPQNVRFYPTAAAAQQAGFRACMRCRPEVSPGAPEWDLVADVAGRAMRLIGDGEVDRTGVPGLAARLGYSERQLHRVLVAQLGAGPLALARAQRARTAALLIEGTAMTFTDVAFAAGFGSLRQFNETVRETFGRTPTELRRGARAAVPADAGGTPPPLTLRLPRRDPFPGGEVFAFLRARLVPGLDRADGDAYVRSLDLPHGPGVCVLRDAPGAVECTLRLSDLRDLAAAVARCRRLLDLDADPVAVDEHLARDPALAPAVAATPGRRVPGAVDGFELAVRAVIGQQVSVVAARTVLGRIVLAHGAPLGSALDPLPAGADPAGADPSGAASFAPIPSDAAASGPEREALRRFPSPTAVAALPDEAFAMPRARARALRGLAEAVAGGELDLGGGAPRDEVREQLLALPGIGPWTASYVAMRALGDPDAFPATDLGVRQGAAALGLPDEARALAARAADWAPWRAYAAQHLWAAAVPAPRSGTTRGADPVGAPSTGGAPHRTCSVTSTRSTPTRSTSTTRKAEEAPA